MSQDDAEVASGVVLEELSSWSEEMCRRELPSVLPRLLSMYQCSESWIEHIRKNFKNHC
uniref:FIGNL1 interacting regulator of recombination and mitosis n=1 Tax=Mus musculus TaxID=10090 RepID=E0CX91_MOUSE